MDIIIINLFKQQAATNSHRKLGTASRVLLDPQSYELYSSSIYSPWANQKCKKLHSKIYTSRKHMNGNFCITKSTIGFTSNSWQWHWAWRSFNEGCWGVCWNNPKPQGIGTFFIAPELAKALKDFEIHLVLTKTTAEITPWNHWRKVCPSNEKCLQPGSQNFL